MKKKNHSENIWWMKVTFYCLHNSRPETARESEEEIPFSKKKQRELAWISEENCRSAPSFTSHTWWCDEHHLSRNQLSWCLITFPNECENSTSFSLFHFSSCSRVFHESKNEILIVFSTWRASKESKKEFRLTRKAIERLLPLKKTSSSIQLTNIWRQSERVSKRVCRPDDSTTSGGIDRWWCHFIRLNLNES
jgi:hypothetical protein